MCNSSMLFATDSWQQTILWGHCSASDSRGISPSKKFGNTFGVIRYFQVELIVFLVRINLPRLTVMRKQNKL